MVLILIIVAVALIASWIFCQGLAFAAKEAQRISEVWEMEQKEEVQESIESHLTSSESFGQK